MKTRVISQQMKPIDPDRQARTAQKERILSEADLDEIAGGGGLPGGVLAGGGSRAGGAR